MSWVSDWSVNPSCKADFIVKFEQGDLQLDQLQNLLMSASLNPAIHSSWFEYKCHRKKIVLANKELINPHLAGPGYIRFHCSRLYG